MSIRKTKDSDITMIRIVAMIMIVLCHLCTWFGYSALGLVFDVGVQIFFFISGWCYCEKKIKQPVKWLVERWRKLCIPAYVWSSVMLLITYFVGEWKAPLWQYVLSHGFNLQGWDQVFPGIHLEWIICINGCGPMWFLTALMFCYLIMLVVKYLAWKCTNKTELLIYILIGGILLCVASLFGLCLEWVYVYFLGYFSKSIWLKISKKQYILMALCMISTMMVRLLGKTYLDGTIWYDSIIVYLTHNVLAVWIIATIRWINQKSNMIKNVLSVRLIQWLDKYQYEVFLVHYGVWLIISIFVNNSMMKIMVFAILVSLISMLLHQICKIKSV